MFYFLDILSFFILTLCTYLIDRFRVYISLIQTFWFSYFIGGVICQIDLVFCFWRYRLFNLVQLVFWWCILFLSLHKRCGKSWFLLLCVVRNLYWVFICEQLFRSILSKIQPFHRFSYLLGFGFRRRVTLLSYVPLSEIAQKWCKLYRVWFLPNFSWNLIVYNLWAQLTNFNSVLWSGLLHILQNLRVLKTL